MCTCIRARLCRYTRAHDHHCLYRYRRRKFHEVDVRGRVVLNLWRVMTDQLKLRSYSQESVVQHVLRRTLPQIPNETLTRWFWATAHHLQSDARDGPAPDPDPERGAGMSKCLGYCLERARLNLAVMAALDLVGRTSELARVFGITFTNVLFKGSQYRVESLLLRIAKSQRLLLKTMSKQQVYMCGVPRRLVRVREGLFCATENLPI